MSLGQNSFKSFSSGLKELILEDLSNQRFTKLLGFARNNEAQKVIDYFNENPHHLDDMKLKALLIYCKAFLSMDIKETDISLTGIKKFLQAGLAKELTAIHLELKKEIDLDKLKVLFPSLAEDYTNAKKVIAIENEEKPKYELDLIKTQSEFNAENFKEKLSETFQEIEKIQEHVASENAIDKETCFKANCCDCCTYTPPLVTKLEFEYIKAHYDLTPFMDQADRNQLDHKIDFGHGLKIVDLEIDSNLDYNPNSFAHRCPFLTDKNACAIHEHRPFACRYYGLSTIDGDNVQACNYYLEQFPKDIRTVLDARSPNQVLGQANKELCGGKQLAGTITAWLSDNS